MCVGGSYFVDVLSPAFFPLNIARYSLILVISLLRLKSGDDSNYDPKDIRVFIEKFEIWARLVLTFQVFHKFNKAAELYN